MKKIFIFTVMIGLLAAGWYQLVFVGNKAGDMYQEYEVQAKERMDAGYYVEALDSIEAALSIEPKNRDMQLMQVYCYFNLGKKDEFIKLADNYISLYGGDEKLYAYAAAYYEEQLDYETAMTYLEKGVAEFPDSEELNSELLLVRGKYSQEYTSFTYISPYFDGYAIAESENGYRLINESGNTADGNVQGYKEIYDFYKNENDELIIAVNDGERSCYYDGNGNLRLSPEKSYGYLGGFRDGYALVKDSDGWFYIDSNFETCSEIYEDASSFYNGLAAVKKDGSWYLVDKNFEVVGDEKFDEVLMNEERVCNVAGVAIVKQSDSYYAVNEKGEVISDGCEDAKMYSYNGTTAAVKKDGKWGLMDTDGVFVMTTDYEELASDSEGLVAYKTDGKWGYMDLNGQTIIEPAYEECRAFNKKGYASVYTDGIWKLLRLEIYDGTFGIF